MIMIDACLFLNFDIIFLGIVLFMKGNPIFPQCGFSRQVAEVLKREGYEGKYHFVNVRTLKCIAAVDQRT